MWFNYAHTICINNIAHVRHLLSFWESEAFVHAEAGDAYVTNPNKHLEHQTLMGFPEENHHPHVAKFSLLVGGGEDDALCDPSGEDKNLSKNTHGSSQTLHVFLL